MRRSVALSARFVILCAAPMIRGTAAASDLAEARRPVENQTLRWQAPPRADLQSWNKHGVVGAGRGRTLFALYNEGVRQKNPMLCLSLDDGAPVAFIERLPAGFQRLDADDFLWRVATTDGGLVALPSTGAPGVVAYEPCTLQERWSFPLGPGDEVRALAAAGDTLVAAVGPHETGRWHLMFLDGASGRLRRTSPVFEGPTPDRLLADGGRVLAFADPWPAPGQTQVRDMHLGTFSVSTGARLWRQTEVAAEIVVGGGHVVVIDRRAAELRVRDLATGATETKLPLPRLGDARGVAVAADRRHLYYAVDAWDRGEVAAVALPTGKPRWRRAIPLAQGTELVIARDAVYVADAGYFVTALDPDSGRSRWRWGIGRAFEIVPVPPAAADAPAPPLIVADSAGGLWRFARAERAKPIEPVVISGRVRLAGAPGERQSYELAVGPRRVTTDGRGRFRIVLREAGAIRLAVNGGYDGLWRRGGPEAADHDAVIVRPGGPAGRSRWLDLETTIYEDCH